MTKRQKLVQYIAICITKSNITKNKKELFYLEKQIKKGIKLANIKKI
jgi:hypothetical protein